MRRPIASNSLALLLLPKPLDEGQEHPRKARNVDKGLCDFITIAPPQFDFDLHPLQIPFESARKKDYSVDKLLQTCLATAKVF